MRLDHGAGAAERTLSRLHNALSPNAKNLFRPSLKVPLGSDCGFLVSA